MNVKIGLFIMYLTAHGSLLVCCHHVVDKGNCLSLCFGIHRTLCLRLRRALCLAFVAPVFVHYLHPLK